MLSAILTTSNGLRGYDSVPLSYKYFNFRKGIAYRQICSVLGRRADGILTKWYKYFFLKQQLTKLFSIFKQRIKCKLHKNLKYRVQLLFENAVIHQLPKCCYSSVDKIIVLPSTNRGKFPSSPEVLLIPWCSEAVSHTSEWHSGQSTQRPLDCVLIQGRQERTSCKFSKHKDSKKLRIGLCLRTSKAPRRHASWVDYEPHIASHSWGSEVSGNIF